MGADTPVRGLPGTGAARQGPGAPTSAPDEYTRQIIET
jgi:hypothetical protein